MVLSSPPRCHFLVTIVNDLGGESHKQSVLDVLVEIGFDKLNKCTGDLHGCVHVIVYQPFEHLGDLDQG